MCRQGDTSADALQQQFALAFQGEAARELYLELAELLPSAEQRSQLLRAAEAAGWAPRPAAQGVDMSLAAAVVTGSLGGRAEPDQAAAPGTAAEGSGAGDPGWEPLDRSRIAEAASAMSRPPGDDVQVDCALPAVCITHTLTGLRPQDLGVFGLTPYFVLCSTLKLHMAGGLFRCLSSNKPLLVLMPCRLLAAPALACRMTTGWQDPAGWGAVTQTCHLG